MSHSVIAFTSYVWLLISWSLVGLQAYYVAIGSSLKRSIYLGSAIGVAMSATTFNALVLFH